VVQVEYQRHDGKGLAQEAQRDAGQPSELLGSDLKALIKSPGFMFAVMSAFGT
jgi:hypothetical protein